MHTYKIWDIDDKKERYYTTKKELIVNNLMYLNIGGKVKRVIVMSEINIEEEFDD